MKPRVLAVLYRDRLLLLRTGEVRLKEEEETGGGRDPDTRGSKEEGGVAGQRETRVGSNLVEDRPLVRSTSSFVLSPGSSTPVSGTISEKS